MSDIDQLVGVALNYADAVSGQRILRTSEYHPLAIRRRMVQRMPNWTDAEIEFVRENIARLDYDELGAVLGRSANAIKIIVVRRQIPVKSKRPGWLTGNQVAKALGVDIHSVMAWCQRGILACEILPGNRQILSVRQVTLYRWATRPENWMRFKVRNMGDKHLQKLVDLAQSRWDDEWLSIGEVARLCQVNVRTVNQQVRRGTIPGVQWGNWWIRRSDALKARFIIGKGYTPVYDWSPRADAFLVQARSEGKTIADIARLMKWPEKRVFYRLSCLRKGKKGRNERH